MQLREALQDRNLLASEYQAMYRDASGNLRFAYGVDHSDPFRPAASLVRASAKSSTTWASSSVVCWPMMEPIRRWSASIESSASRSICPQAGGRGRHLCNSMKHERRIGACETLLPSKKNDVAN